MKITDAIQEIRETLGFNAGSPYDVKIGYDDAKRISSLLEVIHSATLVEIKASDLRNICIATQDKDIEKFRKLLYALSVVAKGSFNSKLSNDELVKEVESSINSIVVAAGLVEKDVGAGDRIEKLRQALFIVIDKLGGDTWNGVTWTDDELIENVHGKDGNSKSGIISDTFEREYQSYTRFQDCLNRLMNYLQPGIHRGPDSPDWVETLEKAIDCLSTEHQKEHDWTKIMLLAAREGGVQRKHKPPVQGDEE